MIDKLQYEYFLTELSKEEKQVILNKHGGCLK